MSNVRQAKGSIPESPIVAWRRLRLGHADPDGIETLQAEKCRSVYRLRVRGLSAPTIIVKRCPAAQAAREVVFYANVLPMLGLPTLTLVGTLAAATSGSTWLFIEDAGTEEFHPDDAGHRRLAGSWLGRFQAAGLSRPPMGLALRDRGPRHFEEHLRLGIEAIERGRQSPQLPAADVPVLDGLLVLLRRAEAAWPGLINECDRWPETYVHGDFKPDNLRVRHGPNGPDLVVFDWNEGGWGLPALDLSRFLRSVGVRLPDQPNEQRIIKWIHEMSPDLEAYLAHVGRAWPSLDAAAIRRLGYVGEVFRCVASIRWQAFLFDYAWFEGPMCHLRYFHDWLGPLLDALDW
jgi:Phosphotransferase enzyme family